MKKIRIYLSLLAVVFAIGGAVASAKLYSQSIVYEYISDGVCDEVNLECNTSSPFACKVTAGGPILRQNNTSTNCGIELWMDN